MTSFLFSLATISLFFGQVCFANLYDVYSHIKTFDDYSSFDREVIQGEGIWMVQFFDPDCPICQEMTEKYNALAEVTRGIYNIAAVDMSTQAGQRIGSQHRVGSFPTILMFGDEPIPQTYTGDRTPQDLLQNLLDFLAKTLRIRAGDPRAQNSNSGGGGQSGSSSGSGSGGGGSSKVVKITSANFEKKVLESPLVAFIAFTAPWCGHCKQLEPEWEKAAKKIDGHGALLGWVDATEESELANQFEVQGYPSIKMFPGGDTKSIMDAADYTGGRTTGDIVQAVLAEVDRTGVPKEIPELTSMEVLKEHCSGHNHICVLAALPHILDTGADGRNSYKDSVSTVSKTFRGSAFSFLWFEGTSQSALEQALELTFGFPAIVAFSLDREAYVVMRGSFTEKAITSFLHGVTSGRQQTVKLYHMPSVETTEPWDGQDGVPVEEEMSLADIMGWDDDEEEGGEGEL